MLVMVKGLMLLDAATWETHYLGGSRWPLVAYHGAAPPWFAVEI